MLRMEIALFLVLAFIACVYFSAGKKHTLLHKVFSALLIVILIHLVFDGATVYTVNRLDMIPKTLNDILHRIFIGTMVLAVFFVLSVYCNSGRRGKRETAALGYACKGVLGACGIGRHAAARSLRRYAGGKLLGRYSCRCLLCQRSILSVPLCVDAASKLEADSSEEKIRHRCGALNPVVCFGPSVVQSYMVNQRHGLDFDDFGLLPDIGKPRYSSGRADRTENVHAVLEKSGQPPFFVQHTGHHSDSGTTERRQKSSRSADASGGFLPAQRKGGQADGGAGR